MPYHLEKSGDGYYVVNSDTGRKHSNKPMPRSKAKAQMKALYAAENGTIKEFNYGAKVGQRIAGRLIRGAGGRFGSGDASSAQSDANATIAQNRAANAAAPKTGGRGRKRRAAKPRKARAKKPRAARAKKPRADSKVQAKRKQEREAVFNAMKDNGLNREAFDAITALADGGTPSTDMLSALAGETGLAELTADGTYQLTTAGRSYIRAANRGNVDQARRALVKGQRAVEDAATSTKSVWSAAAVNDLPDSSFLYIESGGEKDADGKTTPRSTRHFPVKDANGKVDAAHLRNAIARIPQSNAPGLDKEALQKKARGMLERQNSSTTKEAGHTGVMLAFFLPALVAQELASQTAAAGVSNPEPTEDLHLTLVYLGDSAQLADSKYQILAGAERYARWASAVMGTISGVGRFHNDEGDGTNALYASVDAPDLNAWRDNLVQTLADQSGILPSATHGYDPHITLAYLPAGTETPTMSLPQLPVTFDTLTVAWGDERVDFPLIRSSPMVFKDKTDRWRWVTFSSTAYRDRDGEIVSTKALADDVARADSDGDYGPLRWWHSPGVELGDCDFNAVTASGRVLVESGTFRSEAIGEKVKAAAPGLQVSLGFHHAATEPVDGVFSSIRRFERSLLPAGYASNPYTRLVVQESPMDQVKQDALKSLVGDDLLKTLLAQSDATTKAAEQAGATFKEADAPAAPVESTPDVEISDDDIGVGDMSPSEYIALQQRANQPVVDALGLLAQALSGQTTKATAVETRLTAVEATATKAAETAAPVPDLASQLAAAQTALKEAQARLAELEGDVPKSLKERQASRSDGTTVTLTDEQLKSMQPSGDPGFMGFILGTPPQQGA